MLGVLEEEQNLKGISTFTLSNLGYLKLPVYSSSLCLLEQTKTYAQPLAEQQSVTTVHLAAHSYACGVWDASKILISLIISRNFLEF